METLRINGQQVKMETRTCKCGCGASFKVMEGSTQEFARRWCNKSAPKQNWKYRSKQTRVMPKPTENKVVLRTKQV